MKTIYKYEIPVEDESSVTMPFNGIFLTAGEQGGRIVAWFAVDTNDIQSQRHFAVRGTGHVLDNGLRYLATVQMEYVFVWHLFERIGHNDSKKENK